MRFLSWVVGLLAWPLAVWRTRRAERIAEWLVSLDGQDLAVLSDPVHEDMLWSWYRVTPLHPSFVPRLLDGEAWNRCRFSVRHRHSGRRVQTFSAGGMPTEPVVHGYRILLRWFVPLDDETGRGAVQASSSSTSSSTCQRASAATSPPASPTASRADEVGRLSARG